MEKKYKGLYENIEKLLKEVDMKNSSEIEKIYKDVDKKYSSIISFGVEPQGTINFRPSLFTSTIVKATLSKEHKDSYTNILNNGIVDLIKTIQRNKQVSKCYMNPEGIGDLIYNLTNESIKYSSNEEIVKKSYKGIVEKIKNKKNGK